MPSTHDDPTPVDRERRDVLSASLAAAAGLLAAGSAAAQAPAASSARALKNVLHVSDPDGWAPALSNAKNLITVQPPIKVRIVTDGAGVYSLQGSNDLTAHLAAVARGGVQIEACHNALDEKKISPTTLPSFIKVVPAGVIALAQARADGYACIKP